MDIVCLVSLCAYNYNRPWADISVWTFTFIYSKAILISRANKEYFRMDCVSGWHQWPDWWHYPSSSQPPSISLCVSPRVLLLPFSPNHLCYLWDFHPQSAGAALPNQSLIIITRSVISSPAALSKTLIIRAEMMSRYISTGRFSSAQIGLLRCQTLFLISLSPLSGGTVLPAAVINERLGRDGVCEWVWGVAH